LFCIDWDNSGVELFGAESTGNFALVEVVAVPCNMKLTQDLFGGFEDRIDEDCVWDLDKQTEYLRPPNMVAFHNQERLNTEKYGEESI